MDPYPIVLRAAKPALDEGLAFARYLDQAAEGFFRFMLGRRSSDIVAAAFLQSGHDLSYENVTFAGRDQAIVGMVSGYTAEQHRRSSNLPLKRAAGRWNLQFLVVSTLFAPLLRIIDTVADDAFYLQAIAVDEEARGEGVGSVLIDFIQDHAVASGSARLSLDVSAKNEGARRLYASHGMKVESEWPKHVSIPGLRLLRMTKAL